jgi:membrane-associated protease RseP (regulator of RpoE activity)
MRITGLVDDGAAGEAGMLADDVIVSIDDTEVADWPSLGGALRAHVAGDSVAVRFWRGNEENRMQVTLKPRSMPEVPQAIEEIKAETIEFTDKMIERFDALFAGVSDEDAGRKPAENEWSAKEVLAHLSLSERFSGDWLLRLAGDGQPTDWPGEGFDMLSEMLAAKPLPELLARYKGDLADSRDLCVAVLDHDPKPWVRHHVAANSHWSTMHIEEHIGQIEEALLSAKK